MVRSTLLAIAAFASSSALLLYVDVAATVA
jgi:hypothetical protein